MDWSKTDSISWKPVLPNSCMSTKICFFGRTLRTLQKTWGPEANGHSIENCESKDINVKLGAPKMLSEMFIVCKVANFRFYWNTANTYNVTKNELLHGNINIISSLKMLMAFQCSRCL